MAWRAVTDQQGQCIAAYLPKQKRPPLGAFSGECLRGHCREPVEWSAVERATHPLCVQERQVSTTEPMDRSVLAAGVRLRAAAGDPGEVALLSLYHPAAQTWGDLYGEKHLTRSRINESKLSEKGLVL